MGLHPNKPTVTWKITNQNVFNTPPQTCWEHLHLGSDPEFRLNSNRHPLLLTRSRRRKWAFCRRDGMWKHRTQYPKNAGNTVTVHYGVLVVYARDPMAVWEPWLTTTAWHHERVLSYTFLAWEKTQIRSTVYTECISLSQNHKLNYCK